MEGPWTVGPTKASRLSPSDLTLQEQVRLLAQRHDMSQAEIRRRFRITKKRWEQDRGDLSHVIKALLPREQVAVLCRRMDTPFKEAAKGINLRKRSAQVEIALLKRFHMQ